MPKTCLLWILLLLSQKLAAQHTESQSGADTGLLPVSQLVNDFEQLRVQKQIPGLSFAVLKNQQVVVAAGLGMANPEQARPATAETVYDIASVSKPLSAVVALALVEQGKLDLDKPMAEYSGWVEWCNLFSQQPTVFAEGLQCTPATHTLRHLLSHTAIGEVGTHFSYNPVLYSWASRPIMAVSDSSFSELVKSYVFEPAGMTHSARKHRNLAVPETLLEQAARPYMLNETGQLVPSPPGSPQGDGAAGGVVSTVLDLAKFDVALDQGRLISDASRQAMMTPMMSAQGQALPYGLGWFIQQYKGLKLVWHSGWWENAYSALYLKIPAQQLTLIILANSEGVWWHNALDEAQIDKSEFVQAFLSRFSH